MRAEGGRGAVGHYRLDGESKAFFGSPVIHLIQRGREVIGRFGRRGVIHGSIEGRVLHVTWRSGDRSGWLRATFDPAFRSFEGVYGTGEAGSAARGSCRATASTSIAKK